MTADDQGRFQRAARREWSIPDMVDGQSLLNWLLQWRFSPLFRHAHVRSHRPFVVVTGQDPTRRPDVRRSYTWVAPRLPWPRTRSRRWRGQSSGCR